MFIVFFLRWLRGSVQFRADHGAVERLISLCAKNGVPLWNCCRRTDYVFTGYTTVFGYHRMHRLARKAGVRTRVIGRRGAPFLFHRYRRRVGILIGALLCAAFLTVMQQFVLVIEVQGCKNLEPQQMVNALQELGVTRGTWKRSVNPLEVKRQLLLMVRELSWATLNLHGNTATLIIRERTMPPPKIDTGVPANVVASRDGQIKRLEVRDGIAVRREGDTVRAGELIVSGVFEDRWGSTHFVRANAQAIAHIPETVTIEIPLVQQSCRLTGKVVRRSYLEAFGVKLPLFLYTKLEGNYKLESRTQTPSLLGFEMPFEVTSENYIFYEKEEYTLREESALQIAKRKLDAQERKNQYEKILTRSVNASCENGKLVLKADYLIEENIAKQVEIPVFDRAQPKDLKKEREMGY